MRRLLEQPDEWERWYALLEERPGSEASVSTRALFLTKQLIDDGLPREQAVERVLSGMERGAAVEDNDQRAAPRGRLFRLPWLTAGVGLLAAGFLIGVLLPPRAPDRPAPLPSDEPIWRGEAPTVSAGTLRIFLDAVEWRETIIGAGPRPTIPSGQLELLWEGDDTLDAWAWTLTEPTPVSLKTGAPEPSLKPGDVLVIAEAAATTAPEDLPALIGDGRLLPVSGFGGVRFIAFDIVAP